MEDSADESKVKSHPFQTANWFSKIFFIWLWPLYYKGYRDNLTEDDLYPVLPEHESVLLGDKLEEEWHKELNRTNRPSLSKALITVFKKDFFCLGIVYALNELCIRLTQPFILAKLLEYYQPDSAMSQWEGYFYSCLIGISAGIVVLAQHNFFFHQVSMAVKVRVAVSTLVYRKALKLSRYSCAEVNVDQVINLISHDISKFEYSVRHIQNIWFGPTEIIVYLIVIYFYIGSSGLKGIMIIALYMPFEVWLCKKASGFTWSIGMRTDKRMRLMNEIINGIKVIKMYTWEKPFENLVEICRRDEMKHIWYNSIVSAIQLSFQLFVNTTAIHFCIAAYVFSAHTLDTLHVYVITCFYNILQTNVTERFPEATHLVVESIDRVKKIKSFLLMEEIDANSLGTKDDEKDNILVKLDDVSVKWSKHADKYDLRNLTVNLSNGLTMVVGLAGGGKTTFLYTLAREFFLETGTIKINGKISLASQEPWILEGSIRYNIIFGKPFDSQRYEEVLKVCALDQDMEGFSYGDETMVGEDYLELDDSFKARVNLARAVYAEADIYLLDDPFSVVETDMEQSLFKKCIQGFLKHKCVVLATPQFSYVKYHAKTIICIFDRKIVFTGDYNELEKSDNKYAKFVSELSNRNVPNKEKLNIDKIIGLSKSEVESRIFRSYRIPAKITIGAYNKYFNNEGHWCRFFWIFILFIIAQMMSCLSDYYVTWWVNADIIKLASNNYSSIFNDVFRKKNFTSLTPTALQEFWLSHMTSDHVCLTGFSVLLYLLIILALARSIIFFKNCRSVSINLHRAMFQRIIYAPMIFFNSNHSQQILYRFSHDMNKVDEVLPTTLLSCLQNGLSILFTAVMVIPVNFWLILPAVFFLLLFYLLTVIYTATSTKLGHIHCATKSTLLSYLVASVQGLPIVRASGDQEVFHKQFAQHQNKNTSAVLMLISAARCFSLTLDMHCVLYIFIVSLSLLSFRGEILVGYVGLSLTQALMLPGMFQPCIRQITEFEQQMTCVERIREYIELYPEYDHAFVEPPMNWPSLGKIVFQDLSVRYGKDMSYVLKNLTLIIESQEKIGVVGRCDAGKSSIIVALFRLTLNEGLIVIDDVDIDTVELRRLRAAISIIPQEPVLFRGTLRENLDPFHDYDDKTLWEALKEIRLGELFFELPEGLQTKMLEAGQYLTAGQKQLLYLARAIIKNNKILIFDETTESVDIKTEHLLRKIIQRKFSDCTVITIAQRLPIIMHCDKVLVLDEGEIVEFDAPFLLLQNDDGLFSEMVGDTGKEMAKKLFEMAKKAYEKKNIT